MEKFGFRRLYGTLQTPLSVGQVPSSFGASTIGFATITREKDKKDGDEQRRTKCTRRTKRRDPYDCAADDDSFSYSYITCSYTRASEYFWDLFILSRSLFIPNGCLDHKQARAVHHCLLLQFQARLSPSSNPVIPRKSFIAAVS